MGKASQRKRDRRQAELSPKPAPPHNINGKFILGAVLLFDVAVVIFCVIWFTSPDEGAPQHTQPPTIRSPLINSTTPSIDISLVTTDQLKPKTLGELLAIPASQLHQVDIGRMNLLCATDLPGAENLDIDRALAILDEWAKRVAYETERHLYRVTDPRYADHYRHSEAFLRAEFLLQVLQVDLGVKYDLASANNFKFNNSLVAFIHGMIPSPDQGLQDTPGGTCASMPVLYVAVGRRLGYPLRLVTTDSHIFVRWDGENHPNLAWRKRFNVEGAGYGFNSFEDDYYKTWPFKITDHEVRANGYLLSLSPAEELAQFLAARGHCGSDNRDSFFASRCYENAYRYDSSRPCYRVWFTQAALQSGYTPQTPALIAWLDKVKSGSRFAGVGSSAIPSQNYSMEFPEEAMIQQNQKRPGFTPPQSPIIPQVQPKHPQPHGSQR